MARLIDADELKKRYAWWSEEHASEMFREFKYIFDMVIDNQPTVEPEKPKKLKWRAEAEYSRDNGVASTHYYCPFCREESWYVGDYHYCPYCGGRVEGVE